MPQPRIFDRNSFASALAAAEATTERLVAANIEPELCDHIAEQLGQLRQHVDGRHTLASDQREHINIGPLAADEAVIGDREYAGLLTDLDYAFRRYEALAESSARLPAGRRGIVQIISGAQAFEKKAIALGERLVLGRGERSGLIVRDKTLSARHLEIWWDGVVAQLRCLGMGGLLLNGEKVLRGELRNGDVATIGETTLRFFVERHSKGPSGGQRPAPGWLDELAPAHQRGELFAVLDAARDKRILQLLQEAVDPHASLYQGDRGRFLDDEAPYLVHFDATSSLMTQLVIEGWGQAWGILLRSTSPIRMLRRALRRLLMVDAEGRRERLYFRFYDPRVLGRFWPLSTVRQRSEMLAEIQSIYFEDKDGQLQQLNAQQGAAT